MAAERGQQFPEDENICRECGEKADHEHIEIPSETADFIRQVAAQAQLQASVDESMRTAPANLGDPISLKQHLLEAHDMVPGELYRDDTNADNPNMDPINWDEVDATGLMPEMSHRDLRALHAAEHADDPDYTTFADSHFHH